MELVSVDARVLADILTMLGTNILNRITSAPSVQLCLL